jgi:hypothetical protein
MKNQRHELKRAEHRKAIKKAGGILAYKESKLWGKQILKKKPIKLKKGKK